MTVDVVLREVPSVPTYVVRARSDMLGPGRRALLAERLTAAHSRVTGAPRSLAQVVLEDLRGRDHYIGGRPADAGSIFVHGHVRNDRDDETNAALVTAVRDAVVSTTGVAEDLVWVYLSELAPERMIEFGRPLPAAGEEDAWIAALPESLRARLTRLDDAEGARRDRERDSAQTVLSGAFAAAAEIRDAPDPMDGLAHEDSAVPSPGMLQFHVEEAARLEVDRPEASAVVRTVELLAAGDVDGARHGLATLTGSGRLADHVTALRALLAPERTAPAGAAPLVTAAAAVMGEHRPAP
jgi:phenylpyruvate tautomerase PptA (4-oxalocrotonate tautomerase family)